MKDSQELNVNVFIHGLALCVENKTTIDVIIPNMGHEHTYRAGTFLGEYPLMPRPISMPYFLTGVEPGEARFDAENNLCLHGQTYDTSASMGDVWARITLPQPAEILSLRRSRGPLVADIDPENLVNGKRPAAVHVLRYHAPNLEDVALEPHDAPLGPHTVNARHYLNLHILAEGEAAIETRQHSMGGFQRILNLCPGMRGKTVHIKRGSSLEPVNGDWSDRGFSSIELSTQGERTSALVQAGMQWRNAQSVQQPVAELAGDPPFDCWATPVPYPGPKPPATEPNAGARFADGSAQDCLPILIPLPPRINVGLLPPSNAPGVPPSIPGDDD